MTTLLVFFAGAGLLLSLLSLPLIWGKIGPNPWYGLRVKQTLEDPAVWYPANAFLARGLFVVGLLTVAAAGSLYLVPEIPLEVYALSVAGIVLTGLVIVVVASFRYLGRLPRR
jgi:hypothetical protein